MTPYYEDPWLTVYQGDCRSVLAELPAESVHCVITSPPYWGLRDYGDTGQLGLEATPEEYVANMVAVFREVRRVLRNDGTVWLNLGDSYAGGGTIGRNDTGPEDIARRSAAYGTGTGSGSAIGPQGSRPPVAGLKPKDLVGIPWRVAFALQADGWYLRSDIIWSKPNPMPESVTDRPTKAHEYLFLLSKSPRYYFDGEAVRRPISPHNTGKVSVAPHDGNAGRVLSEGHRKNEWREYDEIKGANIRTVWTIATQPYPGAHFATFPRKLVEPCVKAGTSERGVCPECGAPWVRVVDIQRPDDYDPSIEAADPKFRQAMAHRGTSANSRPLGKIFADSLGSSRTTTGWRASCAHTADPIPATVLDPFAGSGTTGMVAQSVNRRAILIDLNGDYLVQAMQRNRDIPLGLGA